MSGGEESGVELTSLSREKVEEEAQEALSPLSTEVVVPAAIFDNGEEDKPKIVVMAYKLCGIPLKATVNINENRETIHTQHFLKESAFWKTFLDFNFIGGCMIIVFLIGYFH